MSIQSVSSLKDVLENHQARSWAKETEAPLGSVRSDFFQDQISGPAGFKISDEISGAGHPLDKQMSFAQMMAGSIGEVNKLQQEANVAIQKLVTGESKNIHETMLAVEQAEIAFKTMNQIRTKVVDAYKQIMNMQV